MKLEPVMDGAPAASGELPIPDGPTPEQRRLRRLDILAALVALVASGGFLANLLLLQAPPPGAPLPEARPAGAIQAFDRSRGNRTTVPLPPAHSTAAPAAPGASAGGVTNGALGYLSIRTTVTGTPAPLVPVSATPNRPAASATSEPPPRRPPANLGANADVTGAVRPPAEVTPSPRILAVQKALAKLGYGPLKVNGRPGGETRTAIQRFQRDRNLSPDGEITDRLVRELASVSGTAIN